MELINNIENKAKFFALYWGQEVFRSIRTLYTVNSGRMSVIDESEYLQLTPLSQITDEHAIDIGYSSGLSATTTFIDSIWRDTYQADYLRSKGYALPWMGLSVEQLVSFGWVKLKEA